MAGIFKNNDIRGVYGDGLTDEVAYRVGRAVVCQIQSRRVAVGRDMRPHSVPLLEHLVRGMMDQGAEVIDLGLCSTPMTYFANGKLGVDASVMITASHNPAPYNGFKMCRSQVVPVSAASGLLEIEAMVHANDFPVPDAQGGLTEFDILPKYREHVQSLAGVSRPVRVAVDFSNGMGWVEHQALEGVVETEGIHDVLDGTFPGHEANPLLIETFADLQQKVRSGPFDFGVYYDGDGDRVGFTDEQGQVISMDLSSALLAGEMLRRKKGPVLYDLRSSRAVPECIEEQGGEAVMCRVGHSLIKEQMRSMQAIFAGELSGHYYFPENYYSESAAFAVLLMAALVSESGQPLSKLVKPLQRYACSGEINFAVDDPKPVFGRLKEMFPVDQLFELDGLSGSFDDWWFNVRSSNTESFLRLNVGAETGEEMAVRRAQIEEVIQSY